MKKAIIKWISIFIVIVLVVCTIRYLRGQLVLSWQVEKVEFRGAATCSGRISDTVELTADEIQEVIECYNTSKNMRSIEGYQCDSDFAYTIHFKDGTSVKIIEAGYYRLRVIPSLGKEYWIDNKSLADFAYELIEYYNLLENEPH